MKMKKRLFGILLSLVMVLGLMPEMSTTAYADGVPQEGENKYVRYCIGYYYGFDARGKSESGDISTTYGNGGYLTKMKVGNNEAIIFNNFSYGKPYTSDDVTAVITGRVRGKSVEITYTLTNSSNEAKTVQIGSAADTQIGEEDEAPCSFTENGIKMTDGTLEFQLIPGGGNFTTRWYGLYSEAYSNVFNDQIDTTTFEGDSGIAWSWTIEIPAGETITKTAELSAGQVGTTQIIYDANGGTGEMDPTVHIPGESIKLNKNTFTKNNCVFQGWDTNSAGTTVVYADKATLTMPDTDTTTLYAVWKENGEITAMNIRVDLINLLYNGQRTLPKEIKELKLEPIIHIALDETESVSRNLTFDLEQGMDNPKKYEKVEFTAKVEDLAPGKYEVTVTGLPKVVYGQEDDIYSADDGMIEGRVLWKYALTAKAEINVKKDSDTNKEETVITVYLIWDDGSRPEEIKVYALPEDEIGAYALRADGTKEYLLFHTYDICMNYLGRDELCRGYERCFHKESPYVNPFVQP